MLINWRAQVSSISSGFCKQMTLKVHPLDRLLKLEGTSRATTLYLGYGEINLQIPGIRGYNEDVVLLVILIMTYAEKVLVMVGSKNYQQGNGNDYKGGTTQGNHNLEADQLQCGHPWVTPVASNLQGGQGPWEGVTPSTTPNPTTHRELYLDNIPGVHPYHTKSHHSSIWDHEYPRPDRHLRALYAGPYAHRASPGSPASHLHCASCHIWGVAPRVLLSTNLPEEPGCLLHCCPGQSLHWKGCFSQPGAIGNPSDGNLGGSTSGSQKDWTLNELNLQGLEDWPKNEQRKAREWLTRWEHLFAGSDLNLGKHQTSDWADWLDTFQRVLLVNTPICMMMWRSTSRRCWTLMPSGKSYSPWASTVILVSRKERT